MEYTKYVAKDSANYSFNKGNSNETSIVLTPEIMSLFVDDVNTDSTKQAELVLYKDDLMKSLCYINSTEGLYDKKGAAIKFDFRRFSSEINTLSTFFGDSDSAKYKVEVVNDVTGKRPRKVLQGFQKEFSIRDYFVAYHTYLTFSKEIGSNSVTLRFQTKQLLDKDVDESETKSHQAYSLPSNLPLQRIFYGAPGTGKSHKTNEIVSQYPDTVRTTFHPDSDYSTFVGAYKPTMETCDVRVTPVVVNDGVGLDQNNGTYKEKRITYKFVKQAFLKAYIKAWKNFLQSSLKTKSGSITFSTQWGDYVITSISENSITVNKTEPLDKSTVQSRWESAWKDSEFKPSTITNHSIAKAVCQWIYDKEENANINSFEDGWSLFLEKAKEGIKDYKPFSQAYTFTVKSNGDVVVTAAQNSYKDAIREFFEKEENNSESTAAGFSRKLKEYGQDFDSAWEKVSNASLCQSSSIPQYLVIEEINRGNCAQIFGDLFQLLDRKNGFSEYPIEADDDVRKALIDDNPEDGLSFHKLTFDEEQKAFINSHFNGQDIADKIINGNVLVLPPNLYIWATMNTSDQSLFPMDSAFKRRWEWEYVPIENDTKFTIKVDNDHIYQWCDFQKAVNQKILDKTFSEDKQMGDYFIKKDVTLDEFISKVMFYLWNDVCKENYHTDDNFFRTKDEKSEDTPEFSFGELMKDKAKNVIGFMNYLEVKIMRPSNPNENDLVGNDASIGGVESKI